MPKQVTVKPSIGSKVKNISGDLASAPIWAETAHDPEGLTIFKNLGSYATLGGHVLGPVGIALGGVVGGITSIFSIGAKRRAEARARRLRQQKFVAHRKQQLQSLETSLRGRQKQQRLRFSTQLQSTLEAAQAGQRVYQHQGLSAVYRNSYIDDVSKGQYRALIARQKERIDMTDNVIGNIDRWQEKIQQEGFTAAQQSGILDKELEKLGEV